VVTKSKKEKMAFFTVSGSDMVFLRFVGLLVRYYCSERSASLSPLQ
jgi:hypothetical protein